MSDLGAQVTKYELEGKEDPFLSSPEEPLFEAWARNLSQGVPKIRIRANDTEKLQTAARESDVVLCPPSPFFKNLMKENTETLFIQLAGGSGRQKYLHDLNALFLTRSFKLHLANEENLRPPYLPFAGIVFAQQLALETLVGHLEKQHNKNAPNKTIFLDQAAKSVLDKLWDSGEMSEKSYFLHNGKYPCYNIYRTKDSGFVGIAAVESRFWKEFREIFQLDLSMSDRFDSTGKTGQILSNMFFNKKTDEVKRIIGERDICVNVFAINEKEKL